MKQNANYPKIIIHRLGGPCMAEPRRSVSSAWLRLLGLTMLVFAAGSRHADANPAPASAVLTTSAPH